MAGKLSQPSPAADPGGEIQELQGYRSDRVRLLLTCLLVAATGGLLLLALSWRPSVKLRLTRRPCSLQQADCVLVKDGYGQFYEEKIIKEKTHKDGSTTPSYFINKKIKYIWDSTVLNFVRLSVLEAGTRCSDLYQNRETGLRHEESMKRHRLYGDNYMKIEPPSVLQLVYEQGVNPFYIMQLYSFVLWLFSGYFEFAITLIVIAVLSITITVWEARRQTMALRRHIKSRMSVRILRKGNPLDKSSVDLVPGEVLIMPGNCPYELDCDVVLLDGYCVVDESALTGESHPLYKVPLPPDDYRLFSIEEHSQNIIFSGTKILQVKGRAEVHAVVIHTGFDTKKGELIRAVMFPKPVDFQFYSDFTKYVIFCIILGLCAAGYAAYAWVKNNAPVTTVVLFSLDMITFVVPALLPMNLSALYGFSQRRLKKSGIYCLCSKYILLCGGVDVFCFDKTGTLTESELGFGTLVPCDPATGFSEPVPEPASLSCDDPRVLTLAACHGLTIIDGEPCGDPLDLPLFNAVDWELHEQEPTADVDFEAPVSTFVRPRRAGGAAPSDHDVAIFKQFPFSAASRRAAVLARRRYGAGFDVFIKGSPEALVGLCDPASVPDNFQAVLDWYTSQGLRVVALAWNRLDQHLTLAQAEEMEQVELEAGCEFLGLVVMLNQVKASSYEPLERLHEVNIIPVMLTGDNLLTAVSVARESGLVPKEQTILRVDAELVPSSINAAQHLRITYTSPETERTQTFLKSKFKAVHGDNYVFAMDGDSFDLICAFDKRTLKPIVHRCRVFGRMAPQQKAQVIEILHDLGRQVGMCGDGCNDCGALRTAHAGVSLSPAEPSAAAPFTARTSSIACVPALVREGRAAQVASFALFKNVFSNGLVILSMALILYTSGCEPLSPHYIILVVVIGLPAPFLLSCTAPAGRLTRLRPPLKLTELTQVASSLIFVVVQFVGLLGVFHYTAAQPWFLPASETTVPITTFYTMDKLQPTYEASAMLVAMCFVLIMSWLTFSPGSPYRQPVYTNRPLMVMILVSLVIASLVMFYRGAAWAAWLNMLYAPDVEYYLVIATFTIAMGLVSYILEVFVIQGYPGLKLSTVFRKTLCKKPQFEIIEEELKQKKGWPPLKQPEDIEVQPEELPAEPEVPPGSQVEEGLGGSVEEIYARGVVRKPSFRDSQWQDQSVASPQLAATAAELAGDGRFRTFQAGRARAAGAGASLAHRPSIILEETPMRPLSAVPVDAQRAAADTAADSSEV